MHDPNEKPDPRPIHRFLKSRLSASVLHQSSFELHMLLVRLKQNRLRRKFRGSRNLLVNIGCGPTGRPGWVNLDAYRASNVSGLVDIRRSLPFEDNSVQAIFCEHVFEHLRAKGEATQFLKECDRVLMPGGLIRIIVPDAGRYLAAYVENGWSSLTEMRQLDAKRHDGTIGVRWDTKMELINHIFRQGDEHKFAYDAETLRLVLQTYFATVVQSQFGQSRDPLAVLDQASRASESLYMEAIK